jgi:hypothetical protein
MSLEEAYATAIKASLTAPGFGASQTQVALGAITASGSAYLQNKTLDDETVLYVDDGDTSKKLKFQLSGLTTGTTRTATVPDSDGTLVYEDLAQTLTNKTLDSPTIRQVMRINNPTNTFNYKIDPGPITGTRTATIPVLTGDDTFVFQAHIQELSNKTLVQPHIQDSDASNVYRIIPGNLTGNVSLNIPAVTGSTDTFALTTFPQTLTNKTIAGGTNTVNIDTLAATGESSGDMIYSNGSTFLRLPIGTDGAALAVSGGVPAWTSPLALQQTFLYASYSRDALGTSDVSYLPELVPLSPANVPALLITQDVTLIGFSLLVLDSVAGAITAGTMTIEIGTRVADAFVSTGTVHTLDSVTNADGVYYDSYTPGTYNFSAGDQVVARITNSGISWSGNSTADINVSAIFATV